VIELAEVTDVGEELADGGAMGGGGGEARASQERYGAVVRRDWL